MGNPFFFININHSERYLHIDCGICIIGGAIWLLILILFIKIHINIIYKLKVILSKRRCLNIELMPFLM